MITRCPKCGADLTHGKLVGVRIEGLHAALRCSSAPPANLKTFCIPCGEPLLEANFTPTREERTESRR